jgi:hypothetical protein
MAAPVGGSAWVGRPRSSDSSCVCKRRIPFDPSVLVNLVFVDVTAPLLLSNSLPGPSDDVHDVLFIHVTSLGLVLLRDAESGCLRFRDLRRAADARSRDWQCWK